MQGRPFLAAFPLALDFLRGYVYHTGSGLRDGYYLYRKVKGDTGLGSLVNCRCILNWEQGNCRWPCCFSCLEKSVMRRMKREILVNTDGGNGGEPMASTQSREELLASLVDIRSVKIDPAQPVEERMKSYVEQIKNPYMFKVGGTVVRVSYANTQATINDNFVNLLSSM